MRRLATPRARTALDRDSVMVGLVGWRDVEQARYDEALGHRPRSVRPGWSAGLGPLRSQWNFRSDSRIGKSLMLACR
jgi:hypothetical protein